MMRAGERVLPPMLNAFLERVARESGTLALDYDGTLAPFRTRRGDAVPHPEVIAPLRAIAQESATRLVVVSGRPVVELDALLQVHPRPELWGAHGWEHLDAGGLTVHLPRIEVTRELDRAERSLRSRLDAAQVERKVASVAVHWRGLGVSEALATEQAARTAFARVTAADLAVRAFDCGLELRGRGHDKGDVMRALLARVPGAPLLYVGDDDTDEDAFAVLSETTNGLGVRVGTMQPTSATLTIPQHTLSVLLEAWLDALRRRRNAPNEDRPPHARSARRRE